MIEQAFNKILYRFAFLLVALFAAFAEWYFLAILCLMVAVWIAALEYANYRKVQQ